MLFCVCAQVAVIAPPPLRSEEAHRVMVGGEVAHCLTPTTHAANTGNKVSYVAPCSSLTLSSLFPRRRLPPPPAGSRSTLFVQLLCLNQSLSRSTGEPLASARSVVDRQVAEKELDLACGKDVFTPTSCVRHRHRGRQRGAGNVQDAVLETEISVNSIF